MARLLEFLRRLRMRLLRRRFEADLAREMQTHLALHAEDAEARGMDAADARFAARRRFGNPTWLLEASREAWGWNWMDQAGQDLRAATRAIGRNRSLSLVAVLLLALGTGVNTLMFSLANALLFDPFPYPDRHQIVAVDLGGSRGSWLASVPVGDYFAWRDRNRSFAAFAAYGTSRMTVTGAARDGFEGPERLVVGRATAGFLRVLGIAPHRGRFFTESEDRAGAPGVVLLSYGTWMRRYGGRDEVIGRTLVVNERLHTIVGVMPARLPLPGSPGCDLWVPASYDAAFADTTRWDGDQIVARLRPHTMLAAAEAELRAIRRQREDGDSSLAPGSLARVRPIGDEIAGYVRPALRALGLSVGFVLLLACVNLAGLLLARATARGHEMAVRAALGAGRARLVRQMLAESVLLSSCGGAIGVLIAHWGIGVVTAAAPPHLGLDDAVRLDPAVLAFAAGLSVATGLAFGLVPAIYASSPRLAGILQGSRTTTAPRRARRTLAALVATEIALAVVLLAGGGLMLRSFVGLLRVDTGIHARRLLTFEVALPEAGYDNDTKRASAHSALLDRLRGTPGVTAAGLVSHLPMSRQYQGDWFRVDGHPLSPAGSRPIAQYLTASDGYFGAAGIPILAGREFAATDSAAGSRVAVINEAFARLHLAGEDPLAHTVNGARIIGVAGDVRHNGPGMPADAQIYTPLAQRPGSHFGVVIRTAADPAGMTGPVRAALLAATPGLPMDRVKTMDQLISESMAESRISSAMAVAFAVFALGLAAIGIYGVMAFSVGQRSHEIGVRLALGASPGRVVRLVLTDGLRLTAAGIVVGIPAAVAASRLLVSLLTGVSPRDPLVLLLVPLTLVAVAIAASYLPARGAARVEPLAVLRSE